MNGWRRAVVPACVGWLMCVGAAAGAPALVVKDLACEDRANPLGVDVPRPALAWHLTSDQRGQVQTAYQVLAASSPDLLSQGKGDLWDSGRVTSDQSVWVAYAGRALSSGQQVFWSVRAWDGAGTPSAWSAPATWTAGMANDADWQAKWIAGDAPAPERAARGYHAGETTNLNELKWVQVDLGQPTAISSIRLIPMRHDGTDGFGFPQKFKVEVSNDPDFAKGAVVADHTKVEFPNPGVKPVVLDTGKIVSGPTGPVRYVRVTATRLRLRRGFQKACFALSQLEAISGGKNVAAGKPVTAKDTVEDFGWGKASLTDGLAAGGEGAARLSSVLLRHDFQVKPGIKRAVAFVCGLGQYDMSLNGQKVGDALLAPGWTVYNKTCLYDTYDVTARLKPGANAVGLFLGNGMYDVPGGRYSKFKVSSGPLKAIAQIKLEYADGTTETVGTDDSWRALPGPVTFSDVFGGEDYDARMEAPGWDEAGFNAAAWQPAGVVAGPGGALKGLSASNPPVRGFDHFKPAATKVIDDHTTVYDMGQNAAIMPRLTVHGPKGSVVRIIPGEAVNRDGRADQTSGGGPSYWQYTLAGRATETYASPFFYRGCRHLEVEAVAPPEGGPLPVVESIESVAVHADSPAVGTFRSSNELFNRIDTLVRFAQESNMVSIMTDCPHREKLGWLEEDHLNGPALRYNFDMGPLFNKVMNDMADSQLDSGLVPTVAPDYVHWGGGDFYDSPEWGSAFLLVAWQQYEFDGDTNLLRTHYAAMKRYVEYLGGKSRDHIVSYGLGDWYDIGPGEPGYSKLTPKGLTATAFYFQDVVVLGRVAKLLGFADDAARYEELAGQIRTAFNAKFFTPDTNQYGTGSQCANAVPLVMGLVEPGRRAAVLANLVEDVRAKGLTAGDVGYRYLLRALADGGRSDVIYAMNNQSDKPGYGMQLARGATSLTEAWDAHASSSQNHFMLGQINEWFYHDLAGIQCDPAGPGFQKIVIRPAVVGDLKWVKASYRSVRGEVVSNWSRTAAGVNVSVTIPVGSTATVYVPASDPAGVKEGTVSAATAPGVHYLRSEGGAAVFAVGSGDYSFSSTGVAAAKSE